MTGNEKLPEKAVRLPHCLVFAPHVDNRSDFSNSHNEHANYSNGHLYECPYNTKKSEKSQLTFSEDERTQVFPLCLGIQVILIIIFMLLGYYLLISILRGEIKDTVVIDITILF